MKSKWVLRILVVVALLAASLTSQIAVDVEDADAITGFDTRILELVNGHRVANGLSPLIEYTPLSEAADAWASSLDQVSSEYCNITANTADSQSIVETQGTPSGTIRVAERFASTCGIVGFSSTSSSPLPECSALRDGTEAIDMWCDLIDGDGLSVIDDPGFTHVGIASRRQYRTSGSGDDVSEQFAIFRFAKTTSSCTSASVTIDMNTNGGDGMGTPGDDVILGTPGDDVIDGGAGDDIICAGAGNDIVIGGPGDDTMSGESGADIIRGNSGFDSIDGGTGSDRLLGGTEADNLVGGEGNDFLGGFGGADTINGGPGNDTIFGGFGADLITGDDGSDVISGLIGNDIISGGSGDDVIYGDRGNDTLQGGFGDDFLAGGNANDFVSGGAGNDSVNGGKGDDVLSGGTGTDVCAGNLHKAGDSADATCETRYGVP